MTDNLFQETEADQPTIDPNKNYLTELVGEGKKFSSAEELAKGKFYADQTVDIMKKRMDEMRTDYLQLRKDHMAKAELEELLTQLKEQRQASSDINQNANEGIKEPAIDPTQLKNLFTETYQELKATETAESNAKAVRDKLIQQYGENYTTRLKQRSAELGLSEADANNLARRSPQAFLKMFDVGQPQEDNTFQTPPRSNQRRDNFAPSGAKERTWAYYQELKKADPKTYYDPKITNQMAQDAVRLGDRFRDGDYYVRGLHEE